MLETVGVALNYRLLGAGESKTARLEGGLDSFVSDEIEMALDCHGDALELSVAPKCAVILEACSLALSFECFAGQQILMNGYQSWTDTRERSVDEAIRGFGKVPNWVIDRWVLDGGGDYRFVDYPNERGVQHGWTYGYVREGNACHLFASLDESRGFTLLKADASAGVIQVIPELSSGAVEAGCKQVLLRLALVDTKADCPEDAVRHAFDRWFESMGLSARKAPLLTGYSSWYRHYENISQDKLLHDLEGAARAFECLDDCGHAKVFQIDDGYAKVGDWLEVDAGLFPEGLKPLAKKACSYGFIPGLWMAPFVCEKDSKLAAEHPGWLLSGADGSLVGTGCHWSGGLALDTLHPEVRDYAKTCIKVAVEEWGFRLLKLDFLFAACMIPHGGMNRGQLMADAVDLLREAAGEDVLLLGCGVPLASAFGKFDYCRIGCDVGLDWDDAVHMRFLNRERVSTRNSLANTVYRAPLNGLAFLNDPDVVFLRRDIKLSRAQQEDLLMGDACFGAMLLTSDDMGEWSEEDRTLFQEALCLQQVANRQFGDGVVE